MPIVDRFSKAVPPRNNGSPNIARSSIDNLSVAIKQQYENSLSVNARPVLYYSKKLSGKRCTCSHVNTTNPDGTSGIVTIPGTVTVLAPQDFGTQDYIDRVLSGTTFSVDRYGTRPNSTTPITPPEGIPTPILDRTSTQMGDPFSKNVEAESIDDFIETPAGENVLTSGNPTSCAVCLNTGFVGGYDPLNFNRVVFDAQYLGWQNIALDNSVRPFAMISTGALAIMVPVPRGIVRLVTVKLWNNRKPVVNARITTYNSQPLTTTALQAAGSILPLYIDLSDASTDHFTHLEIMFDIGNPPILVEWNKLQLEENLEVADQINDVSLIVSPSVPQVSLYDIIVEDVFNHSWKITSVGTNFDREKRVFGWGVNARVLQPYELYNLLPHMNLRTSRWANRIMQPLQQEPGVMGPAEPFSPGNSTPNR